jgi:hypothetical protein
MTTSDVDTVFKAVGAGSVAFGVVGTVAPGLLRRTYGDRASTGGSLDYFGRTWGTRTAVLGALTLMASSDAERKRIASLAAAMNAMDALVALGTDGLPRTTRWMAALSSAAFSVAAGYAAAGT